MHLSLLFPFFSETVSSRSNKLKTFMDWVCSIWLSASYWHWLFLMIVQQVIRLIISTDLQLNNQLITFSVITLISVHSGSLLGHNGLIRHDRSGFRELWMLRFLGLPVPCATIRNSVVGADLKFRKFSKNQ